MESLALLDAAADILFFSWPIMPLNTDTEKMTLIHIVPKVLWTYRYPKSSIFLPHPPTISGAFVTLTSTLCTPVASRPPHTLLLGYVSSNKQHKKDRALYCQQVTYINQKPPTQIQLKVTLNKNTEPCLSVSCLAKLNCQANSCSTVTVAAARTKIVYCRSDARSERKTKTEHET